MIYITTPYDDNRVIVHYEEPEEYVLAVEELPDGDGMLLYEDGQLARRIVGYDNPSSEQTPSNDYDAFLAGLMEGYQNG